eukprot:TRINITY_DN12910_c0_g1_i4.p1 TRINITY_DN12910_c0_g1~~TRINITY_DN12910_c0_g1_i4.p1  ORF type:complete len:203 (+),score=20.73 TRINITY_DN12910_c0_g1_i4:78-611(+)
MECSICLRDWNGMTCVPKSLPCGHSFCTQCLEDFYAKHKSGIVCPIDSTEHKMTHGELQVLPKNFSLLSLISSQDPTKQTKVPEASEHKEAIPVSYDLVNSQIKQSPFCKQHQMLLHSFIPATNQLLCDKCLTELPKSITTIYPIPKVCSREVVRCATNCDRSCSKSRTCSCSRRVR